MVARSNPLKTHDDSPETQEHEVNVQFTRKKKTHRNPQKLGKLDSKCAERKWVMGRSIGNGFDRWAFQGVPVSPRFFSFFFCAAAKFAHPPIRKTKPNQITRRRKRSRPTSAPTTAFPYSFPFLFYFFFFLYFFFVLKLQSSPTAARKRCSRKLGRKCFSVL